MKRLTYSRTVTKACAVFMTMWFMSNLLSVDFFSSTSIYEDYAGVAAKIEFLNTPDIVKVFYRLVIAVITFIAHPFWSAWWVLVCPFVIASLAIFDEWALRSKGVELDDSQDALILFAASTVRMLAAISLGVWLVTYLVTLEPAAWFSSHVFFSLVGIYWAARAVVWIYHPKVYGKANPAIN